MANEQAKRDQNHVPTLLGTLNSDGTSTVLIKADPSTHSLNVEDNTTGTDNGGTIDRRDNNFVPAFLAVSESDGVTPVVVYANSDGELLIDSN